MSSTVEVNALIGSYVVYDTPKDFDFSYQMDSFRSQRALGWSCVEKDLGSSNYHFIALVVTTIK